MARGEGRRTNNVANCQLSIVNCRAFAAGALYAFASNRAVYAALGHYDMVTTQWIPFYALGLLRSLDGRLSPAARRRSAILAGLFFAFTGLAEMISALFLAMFTIIVLFTWIRRGTATESPNADLRGFTRIDAVTSHPRSSAFIRVLVSSAFYLLIIAVVAFVAWSPALLPILQAFRTSSFDLKGWGDASSLSADLLGWFTPTVFHPFFGGDVVDALHQVQLRALNPELPGFRDINTVFLGWASLALALVGAFAYRRKVATWIWTAVIFGVLTLGPLLQINGRSIFDFDGLQTTFPLPFIVLHYLPVIKANRAPNRNSVLLMLGLAVLVGYGVYWILGKLAKRENQDPRVQGIRASAGVARPLVTLLAVGLILFEHLALPYSLSDARIPAVYDQIAADPNPVSVLQLPLGWRNSFGVFGPEETLLQYYQSAHGKPMLGGNISRAPDFKMDYFKRIPFFQALTEIEFGRPVAPDVLDAARTQAADLMYLFDTGYVVLTPPIPDRLPYADTWQASWDFVKSTLPLEDKPFWAQDGIEAYRLVQPEGSDAFRLDLGEAGTFPYRGEGWDAVEVDHSYDASATWATDRRSRLFVPLRKIDPNATYAVRMRVHPFAYPGSGAQSVRLLVNGAALESRSLVDDWQEIEWQASGAALMNGLNRFDLEWDHTATPREVVGGDRQIGSTGVQLPIDADLKAFADGGFIALFDEAGQQSDASAGRRGVDVTVLDPKSGAVREKIGFDTTASDNESRQLAAFLQGIEPATPVLVASYGDAWTHLTQEAVDALRALGADISLDGLQGKYFALAGVQGAQPGTAAQAIDAQEAFLRISLNRDRRTLAAAVDWLEIQPTSSP